MKEDKETTDIINAEIAVNIPEEVKTEAADNPVIPIQEEKKATVKKRKTPKKNIGKVIRFLNPKNIFSGRMISIDFILQRWKTLLVAFFILMFYISNRYSCQQKISEIGELRREVEEIGYKSLDMFSRLKRLQREDAVMRMVQEKGLNLTYPSTPPYVITYKEDGSE